jgi:predicted RNase H-like nuclease (RuvC/YqgF family)
MTDEDRLLLNELKASVQRLFQEYEKLKAENELLMGNVALLTGKISGLEHENDGLMRENEKIRIANRILTGDDKDGEAKKRINKLVREIDKCIALLNSNER